MPSKFLGQLERSTHRHCELDPDLDATSLGLLACCIKIPLYMALARSWVTREIANHDGGLRQLGMMEWSLQPGKLSLQSVRAAFKKLTISNACPLERLGQWQAFAKKHKLVVKGCDQRMWTANLFHKLTQSGAWEKVRGPVLRMRRWRSIWSSTAAAKDGPARHLAFTSPW